MTAALHPRLRRDLVWRRLVIEGQDTFVFRDDLANEYTKLDPVTAQLALELDGTVSPEALLERARERWPGLEFDADYVDDMLRDLRQMKFLEDPFERSAMVAARVRTERAQITSQTFRNVFMIPLGTVNPDRFLTRTYPAVAFMFQPFFVALGLALFALSGYLVWLNQDHIVPGARNLLLAGHNPLLGGFLLWLTVTGAIIIHELGHGYAIKHHGGTVNRLGFIFVFGLPCMFCDISDTHLFANWKHRAHVALAGTYTELYVATLATVVWWLTPSTLVVNQLAYNVMLFASVSGILFNYNPLIKADGYFVLSDVLDMSNLQEDAYGYLGYLVRRHVLRMNVETPIVGRRRKQILAIYAIASLAYSAFFTFIIYRLFRRLLIGRFAFAGALVALALLLVVLRKPLGPLVRTARLWALERGAGGRGRRAAGLALAGALLAAVLFLPLPGWRAFDATLEPARTVALTAPEELRLAGASFHAGDAVGAGSIVAVLDADSLLVARASIEASGEAARVAAALARERGDRAEAASGTAARAGEAGGAAALERRLARAELRAPFEARVLTAGIPGLVGERLLAGDTVCVLGDFSRVRALARIEEIDLDDVRVGAAVRMRLRASPGRVLRGRVSGIEPAPEPRANPTDPPRFHVWLTLDDVPAAAREGLSGRARILTPARPLASRIGRLIARFVRADLWV